MGTIIQFPTSDNAFLEFWSVHSISVITLYGKQRNFPRTKRQSRLRELSTDETTEKNTKQKQKMPYRQRQKKPNFALKLFHEIISFHISWRPHWKPPFSHDQWFWELNLCCYKPKSTVLVPSGYSFVTPLKRKPRHITKHLMSGPSGNQLVLFSLESWCFPRLRCGKHQDSRENKTNCFPRDLTLSVYYPCTGVNPLMDNSILLGRG